MWSTCHMKSLQWILGASLVAQRLKHLPGMQETRVQSLGREDPLEKELATHSSTLAWRIPWREEPGRLQSMGSQRVGCYWATKLSFFSFLSTIHITSQVALEVKNPPGNGFDSWVRKIPWRRSTIHLTMWIMWSDFSQPQGQAPFSMFRVNRGPSSLIKVIFRGDFFSHSA